MVLEDKTLHLYMAIRMDLLLPLELLCGASARAMAERGRGSFGPRCIDLVSSWPCPFGMLQQSRRTRYPR